jgi:hypothetical protein
MDLGIKKTDVAPPSDRRWLLSPPNSDALLEPVGVTLDGDEFPTATFPDGLVPSGTVIAIDSVSGLGVPYDDAYDADPATAGQQGQGHDVAVGHALTDVKVEAGRRATVALVWKGRVKRSFLPANAGLDAAAEGDLDQIRYEQ